MGCFNIQVGYENREMGCPNREVGRLNSKVGCPNSTFSKKKGVSEKKDFFFGGNAVKY